MEIPRIKMKEMRNDIC